MEFEYKNKEYELASLNSLDNKYSYDIVVILEKKYYLYDSEKMEDVEITKEEYIKEYEFGCVCNNYKLVNFFYGLDGYDKDEMLRIAKEMIEFTYKNDSTENTQLEF